MRRETAGQRFRRFAKEMDLSAGAVGRRLGPPDDPTSDVAVLQWFDDQAPSPEYRAAIEVLTSEWKDGPIRREEWGLTQREERLVGKLSHVVPVTPPPPSPPEAP